MTTAKIVHIITKMELGGAQQNTLFTVSHLNPDKFQAYLIIGAGDVLFDEARSLGCTFVIPDLIREVRPWRDVMAFFQLRTILKKIQDTPPKTAPVIVHTHSSKAGILGRWAARFSGIHLLVHSIHGFGFHDYQPFLVRNLFILLERLTSYVTTRFIAVSRANLEKGISLNLFPARKAVLIRSGIEIDQFMHPRVSRETVRARVGISGSAPVAAMIACFKTQKAPLDFIRVCDLVRREVPDAHFLLVGDGVLRERIEKEIAIRELQHVVHLLGWRQDIPELLHASDVLVLTSLWEGLPRVFPQAMAAGIPVVATRVDGAPEAVRDGVNGFLLPPGDVQGMAEKIILLLKKPQQARSMGINGRARVAEFDIYRMLRHQENLYEELLAAADPPCPTMITPERGSH